MTNIGDIVIHKDPYIGEISLKLMFIEDNGVTDCVNYWYHEKFGYFIDKGGRSTHTAHMVNVSREIIEILAKNAFNENTGIRI